MNDAALLAAITPEKIREWAYDGNPQLAAIDKDETFGGAYKIAGGKLIQRIADYEVALPTLEDCERAVRKLARRVESALCGAASLSRDGLRGPLTAPGVTPIYVWEGRPVTLYSLGPVPHMLSRDGLYITVRFGFYGNTGPKS